MINENLSKAEIWALCRKHMASKELGAGAWRSMGFTFSKYAYEIASELRSELDSTLSIAHRGDGWIEELLLDGDFASAIPMQLNSNALTVGHFAIGTFAKPKDLSLEGFEFRELVLPEVKFQSTLLWTRPFELTMVTTCIECSNACENEFTVLAEDHLDLTYVCNDNRCTSKWVTEAWEEGTKDGFKEAVSIFVSGHASQHRRP